MSFDFWEFLILKGTPRDHLAKGWEEGLAPAPIFAQLDCSMSSNLIASLPWKASPNHQATTNPCPRPTQVVDLNKTLGSLTMGNLCQTLPSQPSQE